MPDRFEGVPYFAVFMSALAFLFVPCVTSEDGDPGRPLVRPASRALRARSRPALLRTSLGVEVVQAQRCRKQFGASRPELDPPLAAGHETATTSRYAQEASDQGEYRRVTFSLPAYVQADREALCGEFNDWSFENLKLEHDSDGSGKQRRPQAWPHLPLSVPA